MDDNSMTTIRKHFQVEAAGPKHPKHFLIVCPKCDAMWHLGKTEITVGNVLHLLNHARSHDKEDQ